MKTTLKHYRNLVDILGKSYVREEIDSPYDFIHIAAKGINSNVITNFRKHFNISLQATAEMLNVSEPTIYRWTKANKRLERNFTVKLFEITDLFLYGSEVFKNKEKFLQWLDLPNTALGGMQPNELIEIPGGVSKIKDVIGRIEHGVYS
jgi:putative toxin-antitoxin system antitoxin component (TIGR02293 family)